MLRAFRENFLTRSLLRKIERHPTARDRDPHEPPTTAGAHEDLCRLLTTLGNHVPWTAGPFRC